LMSDSDTWISIFLSLILLFSGMCFIHPTRSRSINAGGLRR
jgi:hypothetical protein